MIVCGALVGEVDQIAQQRGWEVDIQVVLPDGTPVRQRKKAPVSSKSGALRWGKERERHLVRHGSANARKEVPTLAETIKAVGGHR